MDRLEREGTTFLNKQVEDTKRLRYVAPAVVTVLTVALMTGLMALMIWGFTIDAEEAPPLPLVVVLVAIPGVIILGASSDHLMLDVTDSEKEYRVGDIVQLQLGYFSTMRAFTSEYVEKVYLG